MTPEAQLLAISQIVEPQHRWEIFEDIYTGAQQPYTKLVGYRYPAHSGWILSKPYLNDLNAMHEAEGLLTSRMGYVRMLGAVITGVASLQWPSVFATPPQRAEAFLRTLGKWVEE